MHSGIWEIPQKSYKFETWGESEHNLDLVFDPNVEENDPLMLNVYGMEDDSLSTNEWLGCVNVYFSPDGNPIAAVEDLNPICIGYAIPFELIGNWAVGEDYSVDSHNGDYTIYFRIILER